MAELMVDNQEAERAVDPVTIDDVKQWIGRGLIETTDRGRGISSKLPRALTPDGLVGGVGAESDLDDHVDALVDLLALHHYEVLAGVKPHNCVRLVIGEGPRTAAALEALASLRHAHTGWPRIDIRVLSRSGNKLEVSQPVEGPGPLFAGEPVERWATYLKKWEAAKPTGAAQQIVARQGFSSRLRLYPRLSQPPAKPRWSLRLDGLEIGEISATGGVLQIGSGKGSKHVAVAAWKQANGNLGPFQFGLDQVGTACDLIAVLIDDLGGGPSSPCKHGAPEHSLESAVLRGATEVRIGGRKLDTLGDPNSPVARGSQMPTLWHTDGAPRYLDSLLRDGQVPWAMEMKVQDGGGYGRYLRHAIGQAVLYRHYLRSTPALRGWFKSQGLDQQALRAAVCYPQPSPAVDRKIARGIRNLHLTAISFDVQVVTVDAPWLV
jgi:hypothetical protein